MSESKTKQRMRKQIQQAFLSQLAEKGLFEITVTSISKTAQIHRSTFYEYYIDIPNLLEDVETHLLADLNACISSVHGKLTEQKLDEISDKGLDFMKKNGDTLILLLGSKGDPDFVMKFTETVKPSISTAFQFEEFTPQMNTAVTFATFGLIGVFTSWYNSGKQEPLDELIRTSQKLLYGVIQDSLR